MPLASRSLVTEDRTSVRKSLSHPFDGGRESVSSAAVHAQQGEQGQPCEGKTEHQAPARRSTDQDPASCSSSAADCSGYMCLSSLSMLSRTHVNDLARASAHPFVRGENLCPAWAPCPDPQAFPPFLRAPAAVFLRRCLARASSAGSSGNPSLKHSICSTLGNVSM